MSAPAIDASGVTKRFPRGRGAVTVLEGLDLVLSPGELVAVTGPSLSGKTVLVDLLAGWARPDAGAIVWAGGSTVPPAWSDLTVIPQAFALLEELTVEENIVLARRLVRRRARRVARRVARGDGRRVARGDARRVDRRIARRRGPGDDGDDGLDDLVGPLGLSRLRARRAMELSVGERQRVMVARALVDHPPVVLADEPVAHQDWHHARVVVDLLRRAVDDGAACLVATRQPDVAEQADRCVELAPTLDM